MDGFTKPQGNHFYMFMVIIANRIVLRNFMTITV